jgi:hypothetical protein
MRTALASGLTPTMRATPDDPPLESAAGRVIRSQTHLPLSGFRVVVVTDTVTGRCSFEVYQRGGEFLEVVSDSLLDPGVLRGGWSGKLPGDTSRWAVVVGRSSSNVVTVTFEGRCRKPLMARFAPPPDPSHEFWALEAMVEATHVVASVSARPVSRVRLRRLG